jgi:hypothetical protein
MANKTPSGHELHPSLALHWGFLQGKGRGEAMLDDTQLIERGGLSSARWSDLNSFGGRGRDMGGSRERGSRLSWCTVVMTFSSIARSVMI